MLPSHSIGEIKVSYKTNREPFGKISNSRNAYDFLHQIWDADLIEYQEQFCIVCLSRSNYIIAYQFISTGGTSSTVVDPKMVFQVGLIANASSLILAHNHPSGNVHPSEADKSITRKLVQVGRTLEMPIVDHIIVSPSKYYSFADEGII